MKISLLNRKGTSIIALICLVLLSLYSSAFAMTHLDKARMLDDYVKRQHRSSIANSSKNSKTPDDKDIIGGIARGFRYYNKSVPMSRALKYARYVVDSSRKMGIKDPMLVAGIIVKESRVKPNAKSRYAYGLMQVYWKVHRKSIRKKFPHIKTTRDLLKPENNILVGCWIFSGYLKRSRGDVNKALARYLGVKSTRYNSGVLKYRGTMVKQVEILSSSR